MKFLTRIRCRHSSLQFVRNYYGDLINLSGGYRSAWECSECGKPFSRRELYPLADYADGEKYTLPRAAVIYPERVLRSDKNFVRLGAFATGLGLAIELILPGSLRVFYVGGLAFLTCRFYSSYRRMKDLKILEKE